jgi:DNA-binding transcriptional ArsR family regulator
MPEKLKAHDIKVTFTDIVRGHTQVVDPDFGLLYIKHLNCFDSADLDSRKATYENKAKSMGVPTKEEHAKVLEEQEIWTAKEEGQLAQSKIMLRNLHKTKSKLFLKSQVDQIKKQIKQVEGKLSELEAEKKSLFVHTVEGYANKRINEQYLRLSTYKDELVEDHRFSVEEFDDFQDDELGNLVFTYNMATEKFSGDNLKRVALSALFLNFFYLCDDNAVNFYGKPIVELSFYQAELFGYGIKFKNILSDTKNQPPEEVAEDPEKLIEWAEANKNAEAHLGDGGAGKEGSATSLVGATKEDLKHLGINTQTEGISLAKAATKKGGSLNMEDLMKLHGV